MVFPKKERKTGKKHEKHGNVPLIEQRCPIFLGRDLSNKLLDDVVMQIRDFVWHLLQKAKKALHSPSQKVINDCFRNPM